MIRSFLHDALLALLWGIAFTANLYASIGFAIYLAYRYFT